MIRLVASLLLLASASALFSSCASDKVEDPNRVSTIPWNRPEKWEGQGPLGGFTQGSR